MGVAIPGNHIKSSRRQGVCDSEMEPRMTHTIEFHPAEVHDGFSRIVIYGYAGNERIKFDIEYTVIEDLTRSGSTKAAVREHFDAVKELCTKEYALNPGKVVKIDSLPKKV